MLYLNDLSEEPLRSMERPLPIVPAEVIIRSRTNDELVDIKMSTVGPNHSGYKSSE